MLQNPNFVSASWCHKWKCIVSLHNTIVLWTNKIIQNFEENYVPPICRRYIWDISVLYSDLSSMPKYLIMYEQLNTNEIDAFGLKCSPALKQAHLNPLYLCEHAITWRSPEFFVFKISVNIIMILSPLLFPNLVLGRFLCVLKSVYQKACSRC